MIIITSASYIDQEFGSEFGLIPPAFLPVGNQCLYSHQARVLPAGERRVLTVPESFVVSSYDQKRLRDLGIEVLHIPEKLSLGESVIRAINLVAHRPDAPLRILHGDTLIQDLPGEALDVVTLSEVDGAYNWAAWHETGEQRLSQLDEDRMVGSVRIANGYFAFSDCGLFVRSVIRASGSFVQGINNYSLERPVTGLDVERWFDFGHTHTYYRSKARMTTERAFNSLVIGSQTVRKTSRDRRKMEAEYQWYSSLPGDLRTYVPHLVSRLSAPDAGYVIQYLYLPSLSELYVFGRLPLFSWHGIFAGCLALLEACRAHEPDEAMHLPATTFFNDKTRQRLEQWREQSDIDLDSPWSINGHPVPSINEVAQRTGAMISALDDAKPCVVHGDLCFSNIMYDFRSQSIKVIDPRGCLPDGTRSIYGDQRYDIAKLAHSVCGLYDFIIAGNYTLEASGQELRLDLPSSATIRDVQDAFLRLMERQYGLNQRLLFAMQIHLFLSMIPLHADNPERQMAFLANALRLYSEIV